MANFVMRTTKPQNSPYYMRKVDGGYSEACKGSPTDPKATVLALSLTTIGSGSLSSRFSSSVAAATDPIGIFGIIDVPN